MSLRLFSHTVSLPVVSLHAEAPVGMLVDFLIDRAHGTIIGGLVSQGGVFKPQIGILLWSDVLSLDQAIFIQDEDVILDPEDLIRQHERYHDHVSLIGLPVNTKAGVRLGEITDYAFEVDSGLLKTFHVVHKKLFAKTERLIDRTQVIEIRKDVMIVKGHLKAVKETQDAEVSAWKQSLIPVSASASGS